MGEIILGWMTTRQDIEGQTYAVKGSNTVDMERNGVLIWVLYRWIYPRRQETILVDHTIIVS